MKYVVYYQTGHKYSISIYLKLTCDWLFVILEGETKHYKFMCPHVCTFFLSSF
jgi:hypothetical protein